MRLGHGARKGEGESRKSCARKTVKFTEAFQQRENILNFLRNFLKVEEEKKLKLHA